MIHKFIYKTLTVRSDMFNNKLKDQVQKLTVQVADLTAQVTQLTTAIHKIHRRKQAETKVNDSMKLTPQLEDYSSKTNWSIFGKRRA